VIFRYGPDKFFFPERYFFGRVDDLNNILFIKILKFYCSKDDKIFLKTLCNDFVNKGVVKKIFF